ncbi:MAG: TauD/TfdA family dioxygenase [Gammaproteobacteria bacterium]|nr:MAG: TauD/TfdA family dioxygenase [Gammaproteobacteria bacterium]
MEFVSTTAASNAPRSYSRIRVRPLTGAIGAEIFHVDLRRLDDLAFAELRQAATDHLVLFFRDQQLDLDEYQAFAARWGSFGSDPFVATMDDHPHVIRVLKEADEKHPLVFGGAWHSDWTFLPTPPSWTLLYARDVPDYGGDTLFANTYLAWEWFSDTFRALLEPLVAVHSPQRAYGADARHNDLLENMKILYGEKAHLSGRHPLVRTHPESGRRALFVNPGYTTGIEGMRPDEAQSLLSYLFQVMTHPAFQCRFRWEPGSIAMWDNRCTLHNPVSDYLGKRRELYRITIAGEAPYLTAAA